MKTIQQIDNGHNLTERPIFISKDGKLMGMIRRSSFNNLYPVATDDIEDFSGFPQTLRLSDVAMFLNSKGYELVTE